MANSPTRVLSESPSRATLSFFPLGSIFTTATSDWASTPRTSPSYSLPSLKRTLILSAPSTTWPFAALLLALLALLVLEAFAELPEHIAKRRVVVLGVDEVLFVRDLDHNDG